MRWSVRLTPVCEFEENRLGFSCQSTAFAGIGNLGITTLAVSVGHTARGRKIVTLSEVALSKCIQTLGRNRSGSAPCCGLGPENSQWERRKEACRVRRVHVGPTNCARWLRPAVLYQRIKERSIESKKKHTIDTVRRRFTCVESQAEAAGGSKLVELRSLQATKTSHKAWHQATPLPSHGNWRCPHRCQVLIRLTRHMGHA